MAYIATVRGSSTFSDVYRTSPIMTVHIPIYISSEITRDVIMAKGTDRAVGVFAS